MNEHKLICMSLHKRGRKSYANWVVCWIKLQYRVKERNMYGNTHPTFFSGWTHKCHKSTRINWFTRLSPFSIFRMLDTKYEPVFFSYINLNFLKRETFNDLNVKTWKKTFLKMSLWVIWTSLSACAWKLHLPWKCNNKEKTHSLLSCKNNSKRKSTLRQD